jgi:hypothetical protein
MRYSFTAYGEHLRHLFRHVYFRTLLVAYAFLVFLGVMPKPPARMPYQSAVEHMILTVTTALTGFIALAVIIAFVCVIGALKRPAQTVPDEASDRRPL